jgi:hypothetical protein
VTKLYVNKHQRLIRALHPASHATAAGDRALQITQLFIHRRLPTVTEHTTFIELTRERHCTIRPQKSTETRMRKTNFTLDQQNNCFVKSQN